MSLTLKVWISFREIGKSFNVISGFEQVGSGSGLIVNAKTIIDKSNISLMRIDIGLNYNLPHQQNIKLHLFI